MTGGRLRRRLGRSLGDERGITLVETIVSVILMTSIVAIMGPVMTSSDRAGRVVTNESNAIDEVRLSIARIDRELRSAECITSPAAGAAASVLTFDTRATGTLHTVSYSVVGGHLVRSEDGGTATDVAVGFVVTGGEFAHSANAGQRAQIGVNLNVRFEANNNTRTVETTIAGRNAWGTC